MLKKTLCVLALCVTPTLGQEKLKLEPQVGDLTGFWSVSGSETGGKKYTGICQIEKRGEIYLVQWSTGGGTFAGVGVRTGETFAVGWATPGQGGGAWTRGVNVYRIESQKKLVGRWASLPGNGQVATETLAWLKEIAEDD